MEKNKEGDFVQATQDKEFMSAEVYSRNKQMDNKSGVESSQEISYCCSCRNCQVV
jgi:hypothetical protein